MKLSISRPKFYRVKKGQTLNCIAEAFGLTPRLLASVNGLKEEVRAGQVIEIPEAKCNLYKVSGGESKTLLCGSAENFASRNGTACFYPAQIVAL